MRITIETGEGTYGATATRIEAANAAALKSPLARRIVALLAEKPRFPRELAEATGAHEQGVYYHVRKLEAAGIVRIESVEQRRGLTAQRYELASDAVVVMLREPKRSSGRAPKRSTWLEPFIKDGTLDARIIVGSPDPHGPLKARSRDGYFGMDLALFLGTFTTIIPEGKVVLDTDARDEDLTGNLIVIGGPIVNAVAGRLNDASPIRFDEDGKRIVSTISGRDYLEEATGVVCSFESPLAERRRVLWVYGLRNAGTRAAITAFLKRFTELRAGNRVDGSASRVVIGVDLDSDGAVDDVEFLE